MLTEQRFERILERLKVKKSITVAEITEDLGISESTARRDITALDKAGKLTKVFGGAVAAEHTYEMKEPTVAQKVNVRKEEKIKIAQYAADMISHIDRFRILKFKIFPCRKNLFPFYQKIDLFQTFPADYRSSFE